MILRVSAKLGKKIRTTPNESLPLALNAFADWSVQLFTADRKQYIIAANTASLYSVLLFGAGITSDTTLACRVVESIRDFMRDDGLAVQYDAFVAPATHTFRFSKRLNPSVTGSMTDLIDHARYHLVRFGDSLHDASARLNEVPMSMLKYQGPRDAIALLPVPRDAHNDE